MPATLDSLHAAAEDGDVDRLNRFLAEGESADARDPEGRTPLMYAIHGRQTVAVRHLLKWGAAVDAQTPQGGTALRQAARGGQAEVVRLLLARGADPNQVVQPEPQPITLEAATQQVEMMAKFRASVGAGSELDEMDESDKAEFEAELSKTPEGIVAESRKMPEPIRTGSRTLMGAIQSGSVETVTMLLDAGIDREMPRSFFTLKLRDKENPPHIGALEIAIRQSSLEMVRTLVEHGFTINSLENGDLTSPLLSAIMGNKIDIARFLLESGADPDAGTMPPLQFAVTMGKIEMAELLLQHGAQTTSRDKISVSLMAREKPEMLALLERYKGTDWHRAVKNGDVELVRARLDAGTVVDACDKPGETALYFAAENGQSDVATLLLARGADPNVATEYGVTPLMRAVGKGHATVTRALIAGGANANAVDRWGRSALYQARGDDRRTDDGQEDNRQRVRELLLTSGAHVGLVEAAFLGYEPIVRDMLSGGTPVNTRNEGGMTALMAAAQNNEREIAALLHDAWGADVHARDKEGQTPLFYAARATARGESDGDDTEMMRLLLDWGAQIDVEGERGSTALQQAISSGKAARVEMLLDHGVDPRRYRYFGSKGKIGRTPLFEAISNATFHEQGPEIVRALLERGADANTPRTFDGKPGDTPLMTACHHWEISEKLTKKFPNVKVERLIEVIRLLLEHGADANASGFMKSVIGNAIVTGSVEIVRLVLDAGARLEGEHGANALLLAADNPEITALLRDRGASEIAPDGTELLPPGMLQRRAEGSASSEASSPNFDTMFAEMRSKMDVRRQRRWSGSMAEEEEAG